MHVSLEVQDADRRPNGKAPLFGTKESEVVSNSTILLLYWETWCKGWGNRKLHVVQSESHQRHSNSQWQVCVHVCNLPNLVTCLLDPAEFCVLDVHESWNPKETHCVLSAWRRFHTSATNTLTIPVEESFIEICSHCAVLFLHWRPVLLTLTMQPTKWPPMMTDDDFTLSMWFLWQPRTLPSLCMHLPFCTFVNLIFWVVSTKKACLFTRWCFFSSILQIQRSDHDQELQPIELTTQK